MDEKINGYFSSEFFVGQNVHVHLNEQNFKLFFHKKKICMKNCIEIVYSLTILNEQKLTEIAMQTQTTHQLLLLNSNTR